ncbi:MAG: sensor histidine kinase, partial [Lachnospiraceae bacterium]
LYSSTFISKTGADKYIKKFYKKCETLFNFLKEYYLKLPDKVRFLIRLGIFVISEVILYAIFKSSLIIAIFATTIFVIYMLYSNFALNKTLQNIEKIHSDPVNSRIDRKNLVGTYKTINDNLNNINDNFSDVLEQLVKSERLKSELVTNVSHDIKTPLTSIINYVGLLKNEDLDSNTARSYINVLDRQSNRLKKLITDLIEASKAATGQIKVDITNCDIGIMAEQIMGEYEDRLNSSGITPAIMEFPKDMYVKADMQCLFRCVDNIMSNICKYSLAGTRMYISFLRDGENTIVTFKNISRDKLDLSPDELMERFVRGDASRSTEGSGLGLSIVSSLMKLMDGELRLEIDGDLFKAGLVLKSL